MTDIDKYTLVSFAPSLVIVAAMIIGTFVAVRYLKRVMAKDAAKAGE